MSSVISSGSKKYAVLIGINYIGTSSELSGCINDANNLKEFLIERCNYLPENILMLTDDKEENKPTKQNIKNSFDLLVNKAKNEQFTELWLSYSGHGSYKNDKSGDEDDQRDEVLCPVDYSKSGMISDDYIYNNLISKLPSGITLFSLMDCCHSGTILDLPYLYKDSVKTNNNNSYEATVISISGCRDDQTSADAYIDSGYEGAMTWSFLNALYHVNYKATMKELIERMRVLLYHDYTQVPMLAISSPDDVDKNLIESSSSYVSEKEVEFTMTVDYWYYESSWNVKNENSGEKIFSEDQTFDSKYQTTNTKVKLNPGSYRLIVKDTYGDGGITSLVTCGLLKLHSAKMTSGSSAEYLFNV